MANSMIRTILFDMGNVLVHFSHDRMCAQIGALCGVEGTGIRALLFDSELQYELECGHITEADVHRWLSNHFGRDMPFDDFLRAGSDIFWLNESIVPVLDRLKAHGYRLVLLSNTSRAHLEWVQREYDVLERFDQLVTSFTAGALKPEPAIYEAALAAADCAPQECFYTDDMPVNVEAARRLGIDAEVFIDTPTLRGHLRDRGIVLDAQ
jgi:putative hydrolase of the HAD superfamily